MQSRTIAIITAASLLLAGCAADAGPKETGGAVVGGVAGGLLGNTIGHGKGRAAATILGAALGAVVGGAIGRKLDDEDRRRAYYAAQRSFESGREAYWENPRTGHRGYERLGRLFGYLWLGMLAATLIVAGQDSHQRALRVDEYAYACDPFGYLIMARGIRQSLAKLELPQFHLDSKQTRLLIDLMQSQQVPLPLWEEMVAPHAHHYFPQAGRVGVQYPPGTGLEWPF